MGNWWSANKHWIEQTHDSSVASTSTSGTLSTSGISSTQNLTCEVFLSFRGPDTRHGFISHLYEGLKRQGIDAFRDEENLEKGFEIHPYLKAAIEKSQYAVVIISERFAESKSCLIELNEIMERERKGCIKVFPVFYHVEPFDVRHLKGKFGEHFTQFRKEVGSKVDTAEWEKWAGTLKEVGKLNGWHVQNRDEADIVQEISLKILYGLVAKPKDISELLFGIETPLKDIMNLLSLESGGVRFIGICGIGGIGKSSLARVIRARASPKFCASCMIDVGKGNFLKLGKQLIHKLLSPEAAKLLETKDEVSAALESRLTNRKVLIVLDDLHERETLNALVKAEWFGDGSRIIITSRERKWPCLDENSIYDVKTLNGRAALQLFCSNAFPKGDPKEEFRELCKELVNLAKGLPLALEFYGSHVKGHKKDYWEGYRDDLKKNVDERVKGHLQITFDRLEPRLRDAFLDIVCFFNFGQDKDYLEKALIWLGHSSNILIDLENKSLLKFVKHETMFVKESLFIHDLLVQIGEEIADQERLWRDKDIVSDLQKDSEKTEIDKLKVLWLRAYSSNEDKPIKICLGAFSKMKNLRMVGILDFSQRLVWCGEYLKLKLSNELCYLFWYEYPFESFPIGFIPTNLNLLNLNNSSIKQPWNGNECFLKLKDIDLRCSRALKETSDFSSVPNLETLNLSYCTNLSLIHPSIGLLKHLKELNFNSCISLEQLPNIITSTSLEVLNLEQCLELKGLPNDIHSKSLKHLNLSSCSKLKNLPASLGKILSLQYIDISGDAIKTFPFSFQRLMFLKEFRAERTRIGGFLVDIVFSKKEKVLNITFNDSNTNLGLLPSPLSSLKCQSLHDVILSYEEESSGYSGLFESGDDEHKELLEVLFSSLKSLSQVSLINCNLEAIPKSIGYWSISRLDLSRNKFTELPNSMFELSNLKVLTLNDCTYLRALPKLPLSLYSLKLQNCPSLVFESLIHGLILNSIDCYSSIAYLDLSKNRFRELPDSLCELFNLEWLGLNDCTFLQTLPKFPLRLESLELTNCPLLQTSVLYSTITYIGFDCKPYMILNLYTQEPMYMMPMDDKEWHSIKPMVACGPTLRSRIPKWFIHTSTSSSKTIQIPMDWNSANDSPDVYDGPDACALFIVYEVYTHERSKTRKRKFDWLENSDISACEGINRIFPEFVCRLQFKEVSTQQTFIIHLPEVAHVGTHGVWVFIEFGDLFRGLELVERWSYLVSIITSSGNVKLKEAGARLLHKDSESELCEVFSDISRPGLDSKSIGNALGNYLDVIGQQYYDRFWL